MVAKMSIHKLHGYMVTPSIDSEMEIRQMLMRSRYGFSVLWYKVKDRKFLKFLKNGLEMLK